MDKKLEQEYFKQIPWEISLASDSEKFRKVENARVNGQLLRTNILANFLAGGWSMSDGIFMINEVDSRDSWSPGKTSFFTPSNNT